MAKNKKDKQFFNIGGIFILLIVIPLALMTFLIANGMFKLGVTIKERAVNILDEKAQEDIKARTVNTADEIASFLMECEKDLQVATIIPSTETVYKQFVSENKRPLWVKKNGKVQNVLVPLYKELALIDRNGNEKIKIVDGKIMPAAKLVNVSIPANTTYNSEVYFSKTKKLNKGDVYVSPVTGWYLNKEAFDQGKRFSGVIRFATPVFDQNGFAGIIVLSLDYQHLAQFTDQRIPTQSERVFESDASTGNYSYMIDPRGNIISHPSDYHIVGLNRNGTVVPTVNEKNNKLLTEKGAEALNLFDLGFMDSNLFTLTKEAVAGKIGVKMYKFHGITKFVAYAPIKFYASNLPAPAGFGAVCLGVEIEKYNEAIQKVSANIEKESKAWTATIIVILGLSMIILFFIMFLLVRGIGRSLQSEIPEGSEGDALSFNDDDEDDDDR